MSSVGATPQPLTRTITLPLLAGAIVVSLAVLFAGTAFRLADAWEKDPNYSHGWLVPLFTLGLAWWAYQRAGNPSRSGEPSRTDSTPCESHGITPVPLRSRHLLEGEPRLGAINVAAGCLLHLLGTVAFGFVFDFFAIILVLHGLAVLVGGRKWAAHFTFPILFLFFMFPLPHWLTSSAALMLQDWVAWITAGILKVFTVCYRRGTSLYLAGVGEPLVVAEECSGLRQIIAFIAAGALLGHVLRHLNNNTGMVYRGLLVLAAVPVAIAANVVRILLMAMGAKAFGTAWIGTWLHHAPVMLSLPLGLMLYGLTAWLLWRLCAKPQVGAASRSAPATPEAAQ